MGSHFHVKVGYYLKLARHAANEYGGWVKIVIRFRQPHQPMGLALIERVII